MSDKNKVVWSEGLFLRTQHLQQQDRYVETLVRGGLQAASLQNFGFRSLSLDQNALEAGTIGLAEASGIFPDGTIFSVPDTANVPDPVKISGENSSGLVSLALPIDKIGVASIDPAHAEASGARYRGEFETVRDNVRGGADPEEVEVAQLAPRLLLPGDALDGYVSMPVARIDGLSADGSVILVDGHLPPALVTAAVPWYAQLAQEIATGLDRVSEAQSGMVLGGSGASVENLLILELANSAHPRISHMLSQDLFHPAEFYLELAGLAGRLATFGSSSRRLATLPAYDHNDPQLGFSALAETLRSMILSLRHVQPKSRPMKVSRHSDNVWTIRIDNPEIIRNSRIVVRVGGDMSEEMLRKIFVQQATVGSADEFESLWKIKLPGIPLKPLHSQPREIPYDGDRLCLELDRSSEHWATLAEAPGFVLGVAGKLDREPQIDCFAVDR